MAIELPEVSLCCNYSQCLVGIVMYVVKTAFAFAQDRVLADVKLCV